MNRSTLRLPDSGICAIRSMGSEEGLEQRKRAVGSLNGADLCADD